MSRLNHLYIIALFITILLISFYLLNIEKENFFSKNSEYKSISKNAKDYQAYQRTWNNKKNINKTIDQILRNKIYVNSKISRFETKNSIKVSITSSDEKALNNFLNRVLNKQMIIKKLLIEKTNINLEI